MTTPPWVLAPREPDATMIQAACDATFGPAPLTPEVAHAVGYGAMIAALPAPPIAPEALDRLAAFERKVSTALYDDLYENVLMAGYQTIAALTADLRALLKAVGR